MRKGMAFPLPLPMRQALDLAGRAGAVGEVPVGAVVMRGTALIATSANAMRTTADPTAHAEIVAIRRAAEAIGSERLDECDLWVTLEPCAMCAGAIQQARLARLVYGAPDPKTGACGSVIDLFSDGRLNHHTTTRSGVLRQDCSSMLSRFFADRRAQQQSGQD
jgi:tRNA(adenine34) deaminase